jgi:predicted DNA-binding transcriptional regulator AlpA
MIMMKTEGSEKTAHEELPRMLDVKGVADVLNCSIRHVHRLRDSGRMPQPVKLGAAIRWPREGIKKWVEEGCPTCWSDRKGGGNEHQQPQQ